MGIQFDSGIADTAHLAHLAALAATNAMSPIPDCIDVVDSGFLLNMICVRMERVRSIHPLDNLLFLNSVSGHCHQDPVMSRGAYIDIVVPGVSSKSASVISIAAQLPFPILLKSNALHSVWEM